MSVGKCNSEAAVWMQLTAKETKVFAKAGLVPASDELIERAEQKEAAAKQILSLDPGVEAEANPLFGGEPGLAVAEAARYQVPPHRLVDLLAIDASRARLSLASTSGDLAMALDAAETAGATTGLEQMIAHSATRAHSTAMQLMSQGQDVLRAFAGPGGRAYQNAEAARLFNAAARMMDACQRGALAL